MSAGKFSFFCILVVLVLMISPAFAQSLVLPLFGSQKSYCGNLLVEGDEECERDSDCLQGGQNYCCFMCSCLPFERQGFPDGMAGITLVSEHTAEKELVFFERDRAFSALNLFYADGQILADDFGKKMLGLKTATVLETETPGGAVQHYTVFTVSVQNLSDRYSGEILVVEPLPDFVADTTSFISREKIVKIGSDFFGVSVGGMPPLETRQYSYAVPFKVDGVYLAGMKRPLFLKKNAILDSCEYIHCDDQNPCTSEKCSNGACVFSPVNDGGSCGIGSTCMSGNCVQIPLSGREDPFSLVWVVLTLAVIFVVLHVIYIFEHHIAEFLEKH